MLNMRGVLVEDQNQGPLDQVLDRRLVVTKACLTHQAKHVLHHKLLLLQSP